MDVVFRMLYAGSLLDQPLLIRRIPSLSSTFALTLSLVSLSSTSKMMVMPVRFFMINCMTPLKYSSRCCWTPSGYSRKIGTLIFQPLPAKNQLMLVRGIAILILDHYLDILNGVIGLHLQVDDLTRNGPHEDPHPTSVTRNSSLRSSSA